MHNATGRPTNQLVPVNYLTPNVRFTPYDGEFRSFDMLLRGAARFDLESSVYEHGYRLLKEIIGFEQAVIGFDEDTRELRLIASVRAAHPGAVLERFRREMDHIVAEDSIRIAASVVDGEVVIVRTFDKDSVTALARRQESRQILLESIVDTIRSRAMARGGAVEAAMLSKLVPAIRSAFEETVEGSYESPAAASAIRAFVDADSDLTNWLLSAVMKPLLNLRDAADREIAARSGLPLSYLRRLDRNEAYLRLAAVDVIEHRRITGYFSAMVELLERTLPPEQAGQALERRPGSERDRAAEAIRLARCIGEAALEEQDALALLKELLDPERSDSWYLKSELLHSLAYLDPRERWANDLLRRSADTPETIRIEAHGGVGAESGRGVPVDLRDVASARGYLRERAARALVLRGEVEYLSCLTTRDPQTLELLEPIDSDSVRSYLRAVIREPKIDDRARGAAYRSLDAQLPFEAAFPLRVAHYCCVDEIALIAAVKRSGPLPDDVATAFGRVFQLARELRPGTTTRAVQQVAIERLMFDGVVPVIMNRLASERSPGRPEWQWVVPALRAAYRCGIDYPVAERIRDLAATAGRADCTTYATPAALADIGSLVAELPLDESELMLRIAELSRVEREREHEKAIGVAALGALLARLLPVIVQPEGA